MTYIKQGWADGVAGATPVSADRLNHMEDGIALAAPLARTGVKSAAYTAAPGELVPVDTATPNANVTVTLPAAPPGGSRVCVKHVAAAAGKTVTLARGGTDVFNKAGGATSVTLTMLNQAVTVQYDAGIWTVVSDDLPLSGLVSVTGLPPSNGVDDTAVLNAALAGGGRFIGLDTYRISAPIYLGANTDLDLAALTLLAGSKSNMIRNRAVTTARTVCNAAFTAGAATFTSATAAFTGGDVGKPLRRYYNDGTFDDTTIASVQDATHATAAANALRTTTATGGASIGTRDTNINIRIGRLTRAAGNGLSGGADDGNNLHSIFLRRVDGWTVDVGSWVSSDGKYGLSVADTVGFHVLRFRPAGCASDGVHLGGHCYAFTVDEVVGVSGDDLSAITTVDYPQYADVVGVVAHGSVNDCDLTGLSNSAATPNAVALYGDPNSVYPIINVAVRRCDDLATPAQRSVHVAENTIGVTVEDCPGNIVFTATTSTTQQFGNRVRGARLDYTGPGGVSSAVFVTNVTMPDGIRVTGATVGGAAGNVTPVVIGPGSVIGEVALDDIRNIRNVGYLLYIYGAGTTVEHASLGPGCYRDGVDYGTGRMVNVDTNATLSKLSIAGAYAKRCQWPIAISQAAAITVYATASRFEGLNDIRADQCALTIRSSACEWSGNGHVTSSGGSVRSIGDFLCDVSRLVHAVGDQAINTTNGNTGTIGFGQAVCISSGAAPNWRSLVSTNTV